MGEKMENKWIQPDNKNLQYSGRIDFDNTKAPVFVYPCTSVKTIFTGTSIKVLLENRHAYWDNYIGFIIDGIQDKIKINEEGNGLYTLAEGLEDKEHTLLLFKRMDSCHMITFGGFLIDNERDVISPKEKPFRKIEVYGDSVSAGELSEAIEYVGKPDPEHNGEYSNSWYSYAWITARKLGAQIHDVAQGGIALLDKTGWFYGPDYIGLERTYDKIQYNPEFGDAKAWDFSRYIPQVVIIAIGQNDSHPVDYMKADYHGEEAKKWLHSYKEFVGKIRKHYPNAFIVLSTTILEHDSNWDQAIEEVCNEIGDKKIAHFLYSQNGKGTPGHIRISEAEMMAEELSCYIESLGEEIWKD
jgi:hypothetical protein